MARRGLREFAPRNHKLPTVCEVLGIPFRETHRAEADARAAAEIARRLVGMGVDVEVGAKVTAAPATPRPTR
jgi:DNA polymerase III epsilon subunit-like protein